jgi:hypothetical protein
VRILSLALLLVAALGAGPSPAAPRLDALVLSDSRGGTHKAQFPPSTARLHLTGKLLETPAGTKVRSEWVATKTDTAAPNLRIDTAEVRASKDKEPRVEFSIPRPAKGWPIGDYRIDLLVNGKKTNEVRFKVK